MNDLIQPYFDWIEAHTHILYPVVGLGVLALISAGVLQAWRSHDLHGLQKTELRREIMGLLRVERVGLSADVLARQLGLPPLKLVRLLEEMQEDGLVSSHTNTQRLTTWHVKGTAPAKPKAG